MVPNSRINSWLSWFIFNLSEKIYKLVACLVHNYCILSTPKLKQFMNTYLSSYPLQHLANASISASSWGKTEPLSMLDHVARPVLFALAHQQHVVCSNGSYVTLTCLTLPLQLSWVPNTFIRVNIMGARHNMYIQIHMRSIVSLLSLLSDPQAGQLAPDFHVRNTMYCPGAVQ